MRIENFEEFGVEETHTGEREREREITLIGMLDGCRERKEKERKGKHSLYS